MVCVSCWASTGASAKRPKTRPSACRVICVPSFRKSLPSSATMSVAFESKLASRIFKLSRSFYRYSKPVSKRTPLPSNPQLESKYGSNEGPRPGPNDLANQLPVQRCSSGAPKSKCQVSTFLRILWPLCGTHGCPLQLLRTPDCSHVACSSGPGLCLQNLTALE